MELIKLKCETCGATLEVNEKLSKVHCNYCGTEFMLDDGSTTQTYRKIDEAKLKEFEIRDKIHARELEYKEREEKRTVLWILLFFGLAILLTFLL